MKTGTQLISLDLLSFEQAEAILNFQIENPSMKFGEIAVHLGFLTQDELDSYLEQKEQVQLLDK